MFQTPRFSPSARPGPVVRAFLPTALFALAATAAAQDTGYDRLWSRAQLYAGGADSVLQNVALTGRFQVDQVNVDSADDSYSDTDLRRFRFGVKMNFLGNFTLHTEAEFDPQDGDLGYRRLTDTYFAWSPRDELEVTIGKHGAPFTMDGQTSSKELLAIDRSNLTNNIWFTTEYMPGVSVKGETSNLVYHLGVYSSGEQDRGFGDSNGGEFVLATLGHDFADRFDVRKALLRFNHVDNEPDANNTFTRPLEHINSLNFSFETERWGVRSDLSSATGYLGQSDLWGVMVMPYYDLKPGLQLVARYTFLESDDENGVRFARYEREIASGRGDEYREMYLGLNYYWYGHKLKLQTGLQYADMQDRAADGGVYTGWAWTTGFRISW